MRRLVACLLVIPMLSACSSKAKKSSDNAAVVKDVQTQGNFLQASSSYEKADGLTGDFANNPEAARFIDNMVEKHGFDRQYLNAALSKAKNLDWVIRLMDRQAPTPSSRKTVPNGSWLRYRSKFITPDNIANGVAFWNQYKGVLQRAYETYGVPPEIIVGIIGVETRWGRVMGKTRILDALATLAFNYPRRADYFASELDVFLEMARKEGTDPTKMKGSFAGAMGYGQFMPAAYKSYAVDFNGDGHINLWDPEDAIGSVAHYFSEHGWKKGEAVAVMANGQLSSDLQDGFNTSYSFEQLSTAGLSPKGSLDNETTVSLLRLDMGSYYQYWYGLPNFYVITRYNHSTYYAMAVWQLGLAVKDAVK